jgi:hypothetical protein
MFEGDITLLPSICNRGRVWHLLWMERMRRVHGDGVCVNVSELVVLADAKDVAKEAIIVRGILAPRVCDDSTLLAWALASDFMVS